MCQVSAPGSKTSKYIDDVITRLTVFGALYVTLVCLLPEFMVVFFDTSFQLGGTAVLIVVVVAMDFYVPSAIAFDEQPVRKVDGKIEFTKLWGVGVRPPRRLESMKVRASVKKNL